MSAPQRYHLLRQPRFDGERRSALRRRGFRIGAGLAMPPLAHGEARWSERLAAEHQEVLDDRTEGERRKIGQKADDDDDAEQQADKQGNVRRKRAGRRKNMPIA